LRILARLPQRGAIKRDRTFPEVTVASRKSKEKKVRTTVSLPKPVYEEAREFVKNSASSAETISVFFVTAITT
jgi:hypothetical protein